MFEKDTKNRICDLSNKYNHYIEEQTVACCRKMKEFEDHICKGISRLTRRFEFGKERRSCSFHGPRQFDREQRLKSDFSGHNEDDNVLQVDASSMHPAVFVFMHVLTDVS